MFSTKVYVEGFLVTIPVIMGFVFQVYRGVNRSFYVFYFERLRLPALARVSVTVFPISVNNLIFSEPP